jgi:hypothetical protein
MSEKKKYDLCFSYVDNNEIYSRCLELPDAEAETLKAALRVLAEDEKYLRNPDGRTNIENMLVPYSEPVFISLAQLKRNWQDGSLGQVPCWAPACDKAFSTNSTQNYE